MFYWCKTLIKALDKEEHEDLTSLLLFPLRFVLKENYKRMKWQTVYCIYTVKVHLLKP